MMIDCEWCGAPILSRDEMTKVTIHNRHSQLREIICQLCTAAIDQTRDIMKATKDANRQKSEEKEPA